MNAIDVVQEEAEKVLGRRASDRFADFVIWEHTGFPSFWAIPSDGNTPEECLRKQVREFFATQRRVP